jgi:hypothetical protein
MTVVLPPEMERALRERADRLRVSVDEVVSQALVWYISIEPELLDEFRAIEQAHAEALWLIEDQLDGKD